jgi:hypothetical protein
MLAEELEARRLIKDSGLDLETGVGGEILVLLVEEASDWTERMRDVGAPLSAAAAALLGARTLSASLFGACREEQGSELAELGGRLYEASATRLPQTRTNYSPTPQRRSWSEASCPKAPEPDRPLARLAKLLSQTDRSTDIIHLPASPGLGAARSAGVAACAQR